MNLVEQRNTWRKAMESGVWYCSNLEDYRKYRNTEDWRSTMLIENLCEYILFLEDALEGLEDENTVLEGYLYDIK